MEQTEAPKTRRSSDAASLTDALSKMASKWAVAEMKNSLPDRIDTFSVFQAVDDAAWEISFDERGNQLRPMPSGVLATCTFEPQTQMITFEVSEDLVMSCMSHETTRSAQRGVSAVVLRVSVAGPNHDIIKIVAPYGPLAQQFRVAVAWMDGLMEASFASLHQRRACFRQEASLMA